MLKVMSALPVSALVNNAANRAGGGSVNYEPAPLVKHDGLSLPPSMHRALRSQTCDWRVILMLRFLFVAVATLGANDCRNSIGGLRLEKLGDLAEALPKLPGAPKSRQSGSEIVRFQIGEDGRARPPEIVCRSCGLTGRFQKNLHSTIHFRLPDEWSQDRRHTFGLVVEFGVAPPQKCLVFRSPSSRGKND